MNATHRPGVTRPEALVLLALGTVVAGLVLPAVGKVRVESNRERCRNNLKQLGQATLKYADDHAGALPVIGGGDLGTGIIPRLLPYTEHHPVAESLAASGRPWHDPANAKLIAKHLALAQCPDTPKPGRLLEGMVGDHAFKAAPTDYTAIPLITEAIRDTFPPGHDRSSALGGLAGRAAMNEISDGLSTTLLGIVEIADKPNRWQAGRLAAPGPAMGGSGTWAANGFNAPRGYSRDGKSFPGPCAMNCSNSAAVYSFHDRGCNFLFADGSVHFLEKGIDVWIFYAVVTRRGGELLTGVDF